MFVLRKTIVILSVIVLILVSAGCDADIGESSFISLSEISMEDESMAQSDAGSEVSGDEDKFYEKSTINVTWLNVWDGSTEYWWSKESSSGIKVLHTGVETDTTSLNWGDTSNKLRQFYMDQVKAAGIDAVVFDLTNGVRWDSACTYIASYCKANGMKFAAAINASSTDDFDQKARQIWTRYAAPTSPYSDAYLLKDGKPLIVAYVGKMVWFNSVKDKDMDYGSRFTAVWASGEDSWADKWGWQAPAKDGPKSSGDSMFITPSVNWTAPSWSITGWRKSLAYLDYGFLLAKQSAPRFLIVGSYDDMRERNGWIVADTTDASFNYRVLEPGMKDTEGTPGLQMRNVEGEISSDAFYNRVKEWLTEGGAKAYYDGGTIADGVYLMKNVYSGRGLTSENPSPYNPDNGAKPNDFTNDRAGVEVTQQVDPGYQQYMSFYHLGNDEYRIVRLSIGFSLEDKGGTVVVDWDSADPAQRWELRKSGDLYRFINKSTGKALAVSSKTSAALTVPDNSSDEKQQWTLDEIAVIN